MAKKKSKGTRKRAAARRTTKRARARAPRSTARTAESVAGRNAVDAIRALERATDEYGANAAVDQLREAVEQIAREHDLPLPDGTWHWLG